MVFWIVLGLIIVIVLILLIQMLLIPIMAYYNRMTDKNYRADSNQLLVGTLSVGIRDEKAVGEVIADFATQSLVSKPAKLYHQANKENTGISVGRRVLIIEVKEGIAYVIPYEEKE